MRPSGVQLQIPTVPPRRTHSGRFGGRNLLSRRKHDPESGKHELEIAVSEGQSLGIRLNPFDLDARLFRARSCSFEQLGRDVGSDYLCAALGRRHRDVARACCDVQHSLARSRCGALEQIVRDRLD